MSQFEADKYPQRAFSRSPLCGLVFFVVNKAACLENVDSEKGKVTNEPISGTQKG